MVWVTLGTLEPLPVPQAEAAIERTPLLSVWTHLIPAPPKDVMARLVEVAEVEVELRAVKLVRVEEALDTNPLLKYQDRLSVAVVDAV